MDTGVRTWGPVVIVLALLPAGFVALRACLPPIGRPTTTDSSASATCAACHSSQLAAWQGSTHARAEWGRDASEWPDGWRAAVAPLANPVAAIGTEPLFQLLVPTEGGRLQVTQRAYDPVRAEWFDVFDDPRSPGDWGHWTGGAMTWNSQCASCHSTGVAKGYDAATDTYQTEVLEHGVGCVSCHGTDHAAPLSAEQQDDACLACHSLRAELTGEFSAGEPLWDHFALTSVDLTDQFHPDGQIRAESFEATAFLGSRMHQAGVRCTTCHDPHTGGLVRPEGQLCEGCHHAMPGFEAHDPHPQGTVGCVGCHMPVTTYMQRDPRHDHGFPVPDPGAPEAHGPDGCTGCHADQTRAWAAEVSERWWPDRTDRRALPAAVHAARQGSDAGVATLLRALDSSRPVGERATSALTLAPWADHPEVSAALLQALAHEEPAIRFAAAAALGHASQVPEHREALTGALLDPVRAIRVEAGRALRSVLGPGDARLEPYVGYLRHNADQPTALHEWGTWHFERGEPDLAVRILERASRMDPASAALHDSLAVALSAVGRPHEAASHLRTAVELEPGDATLWMRLGLAEAGIGDLEGAARALTRATELAPQQPRTHYNLGLAQVGLGQVDAGLASLTRAVTLAPDDAELRYGLAATLWDHGRRAQAREEAARVLARHPAHPGAAALLRAP